MVLGACATQYSSEYMDVTVYRDGYEYNLHFEKGYNIGGLIKRKSNYEHTGTIQKWKPDREVLLILIYPLSFFQETLKKQAVVNPGIKFILYDEESGQTFEYLYENGIVDYVRKLIKEKVLQRLSILKLLQKEGIGDKPEYKVKIQIAFVLTMK